MNDLTQILADTIKKRAFIDGNEIALPYPEVLQAIRAATESAIAVLGVESFEIIGGLLHVREYSTYEFPYPSNWDLYVSQNNAEASKFIESHSEAERHSYILTSTSKREFGWFK